MPKVPGVVCNIDNILVRGRNDDEHLEHLKAVFQNVRQYRFRFFQDSVEYLGSVVSKEGTQMSKREIEAILK